MDTKLYRSRTDAMIAGVCGGLGQYLRIDPTFVRLFFLLLVLGNGIGVLIYFLLWIIVPLEGLSGDASLGDTVRTSSQEIADRTVAMGDELRQLVRHPNPRATLIFGSGLVLLGLLTLIQNLHLPWLHWLDFGMIWPILLIIGGGALLIRYLRGR